MDHTENNVNPTGRDSTTEEFLPGGSKQVRGRTAVIPAFDAAAFEDFAQDLGSSAALDFIETFETLLVTRIERIERALGGEDTEETITALLSLQASAAMAGAAQLHASATRALAELPVVTAPPGALVRKLQGQAQHFRDAAAGVHTSRTTPDAAGRSYRETA
ncbi:hypothetical protein GM708_03330 [Vibrio cholerae]|nr:hypothetical protein [Vibrio cholerae]